ncbi:MAG TPA: hypothetical protein VHQ66_11455 [Myxococcota bacterium]|nr:hypothetical protein [Myxococcota bacterium]
MASEDAGGASPAPARSARARAGRERASVAALVLVCLALYGFGARQLADTGVYEYNDVLFRADTRRAHADLTGPRDKVGRRSSTHPAFVLLHHPLGRGLTNGLAAAGLARPAARKVASATLTAAAGAASAVLALYVFRASGVRPLLAWAFAAVLAVSTAHWVFASVPETFIFSALGLAALTFVALQRPASEWRFQLAAVYSIAVLVSNAVPVAVFALFRHARVRPKDWRDARRSLVRAAGSTALALALVAALGAVQQLVYPDAATARPTQLTRESRWVEWGRWLETPAKTAKILVRHFAVDSVLAPAAERSWNDGRPMASIEEAGRAAYRTRAVAFALWFAVLGVALAGATRVLRRPAVLLALALVAFNAAFHSLFGNDRILYACNWTLFVLLVVACAFDAAGARARRLERPAAALLLAFLLAQLHGNARLFGEIRTAVAGLSAYPPASSRANPSDAQRPDERRGAPPGAE